MDAVIKQFLIEKALVLVPVLWIIGSIVKSTPKIPNWTIPYILLVCGVAGAIAMLGFSASSVVQGILVAGGAVYGNQLLKQTKEGVSSGSSGSSDSGGSNSEVKQ